MNIFPPQIYYLNLRTIAKVLYYHLIRHFSIRRFIIGLIYFLMMMVMNMFNIFFRLLDEIFFPSYRKIEIKEPVFIISNPRSGTTLLHRLMCHDEERFVHIRLYHTLITAITFFRLVDFLTAVDKKIGRPLFRFFNWIEKILFSGWKDVHSAGFNRSEEDEGLYFMSGISPAISLATPYLYHFRELYLLDELNEKKRERIKKFYKATLQRWMYVLGRDKRFLCKSVMSTGRLMILRELFADAKIIYLARNPYEAAPSFIKMFSSSWKMISPAIPENSQEYRELANLAVTYYLHFDKQKKYFNPAHLATLKYDDLIANPYQAVEKIYRQFNMEMGDLFEAKLKEETDQALTYKSKHQYSLEQYGLQKEVIYKALAVVFETYGFEK